MSLLTTVVPLAGGLAFGAWLLPAPWHRTPKEPTVADIIAEAPPELRPAVGTLMNPYALALLLDRVGLGSVRDGFPALEWWEYGPHGITAEFLMAAGQSLKDWNNLDTLAALADSFAVPTVTASRPNPGFVRLEVRVYDTLAVPATVPVAVHNGVDLATAVPDLEAIPVGITEDGEYWLVPVLWNHILLGGATGSGKSSMVWSLFAALGPAIKAGLVDLWVLDPKGGMEFGRGEDKFFVRFACTDTTEMLALLQEAVNEMHERAQRLRAKGIRKHYPTPEEPLVIVFIDEAATLSAFANRKDREKFEELHGLLLSQGRAPGFSVIETVIDPSKDTVPQRQLFPYRVGLRLDEPGQTTMILGQGAANRGARCAEISDKTPGVAFVERDGSTQIIRVRSFLVTDDDIDAIVDTYAIEPKPLVIDPDTDGDDDGMAVAA
ncbi:MULTISPECIES: FtsK/SpoIIIE domain-containing protein [unclassified Nocardia]|uniref:FtsK/SpoIIIE domain-containing protein n=1 Tax=unclassified Nocardia TaxID=2637762 RepID=UPI001CE48304|nr:MULTISPECIES: FtsK/SpoIIIE domain-containing protein [unclassified Nocardia]